MAAWDALLSASFLAGASIGLRECMEAVLVVGLLISYLSKTDRHESVKLVWWGVAAGIALSIATVAVVFAAFDALSVDLELFEGVTMVFAAVILAGVLMHLVRHQGKSELESWANHSYGRYDTLGIAAVTALCVWREGAETVLFTMALGDVASGSLGVFVGIAAAAVLGWGLFSGMMRVDIRWVFRITNASLLLFGAYLMSTGFHELVEAGFLGLEETTTTEVARTALFFAYLVLIGYTAMKASEGSSRTSSPTA